MTDRERKTYAVAILLIVALCAVNAVSVWPVEVMGGVR